MKYQAFLSLTVAQTLWISLCSTTDLAPAPRKFDMIHPKFTIPIHNFLQALSSRRNPVSVAITTEITDAMLRTGCLCCVVFVTTAEKTCYSVSTLKGFRKQNSLCTIQEISKFLKYKEPRYANSGHLLPPSRLLHRNAAGWTRRTLRLHTHEYSPCWENL